MRQEIVEIRQYTLHPGARDTLIELFDREFIEPQEDVGMSIIGQFRVLDDPDRFFWLRGFSDMETRAAGLAAFYGGPVWKAHSAAANATMIDSDNVLLMRPAQEGSGFRLEAPRSELYVANICYFPHCIETGFAAAFERTLSPIASRAGAELRATLVTKHSPNTFPALPVRENEHAFAWFAAFRDVASYDRYLAALDRDNEWQPALDAAAGSMRELEIHRLVPTTGSLLH